MKWASDLNRNYNRTLWAEGPRSTVVLYDYKVRYIQCNSDFEIKPLKAMKQLNI